MEFLSAVLVETGKSIFRFISSRIDTLVNLNDNIKALQEEMGNLTSQKVIIEETIALAILEGKVPTAQVNEWLKKAEKIEHDVKPLLEEDHDDRFTLNCNVCCHYQQSKIAAKKLDEVKQLLINYCTFQIVVSDRNSPVKAVEIMQAPSLVGQEAADIIQRLLEFLNGDVIKRIGVWGMGGVGKTTLVLNLHSALLTEFFDMVIWVQLSKDWDLRTIQSQIAERLKLELEAGETTRGRAHRLRQRLMLRKKLLFILDDVWDRIDLDKVGIPQGDDHTCCKILLTSRFSDVCRAMEVDAAIKVDVLSQEDSWNLFAESAGNVVSLEGIESLARAIATKCCGLPLAIKTLGKSMRDQTKIELWKNALCQLQHSSPFYKSIEDEVFRPLSLSYYSLQSKILQQCFLYCSLYPENFSIKISELIQCWVADGLIDEHLNMEESFNNGIALVENLMDSSLLDQGEAIGTVKMHHVVRDVAIWLSRHEEIYGFFSQSSVSVRDMRIKFQNSFRRVSYMRRMITKLPDRLLECSGLTVLFLQGNPIKKIPDEFFRELRALKVLNLSGTQITSLPPSLLYLVELRALLLRDCCSLEKLPPLEALYKLQVLDLFSTRVRELPKGMEKLHYLRELNLSRTHNLENIEAGTISGLFNLETLDMSFSAYNWELKCGAQHRATFDELLSLERLSVLYIRLDTVNCLASSSAWLKKLRSFNIQISPRSCDLNYLLPPCDEKRVILRGVDLLEEELEGLLCNATALDVVTCGGISGLSEVVTLRHWAKLASLKSLSITSCNWMQNLISKENILPNLQHLVLCRLRNLNDILDGMHPSGGCLRRLRTIEVVDCPRLRIVISYALLRQVQSLEEIKVSVCKRTECIIEGGVSIETLPRLKVIEVRDMINLRTICSGASACPCLQQIEVSNCPKLRKLPLSVCNSATMTEVRGDLRWWNSLRWEENGIKSIFQQRFRACPDNLSFAEDRRA